MAWHLPIRDWVIWNRKYKVNCERICVYLTMDFDRER